MKLGLFQRPIKREKETEQVHGSVLTTSDFDRYTDDEDVVFAGDVRNRGNLETYSDEVDGYKDESDVEDLSSVAVDIVESIESGVSNDDGDKTSEINSNDTKNEEIKDSADIESYSKEEEKSDDISEESEHSEDSETENTEVNNNAPGLDGYDSTEETDDCDDNLNDSNEETDDCDDNLTDSTEETDDCGDNLTDSTEETDDCGDNLTDSSDGIYSDRDEAETGVDDYNDSDNINSNDVNTSDDFVINIDDSGAEDSDSVHENEHKDLIKEMSMKEKFISLDIEEKVEYIKDLFAEFEDLSNYLAEYREKIDQKVNDMKGSIKSLYLQIGTCSLDDARGIVEKIQRYSKHNEALNELANYIDSIMQN